MGVQIPLGEGLIGAVWQEGNAIIITDLPETYSKITSGLGDTKPTSLFICPLQAEQGMDGVIELAGLKELSEEQRSFFSQLAKSLAATLSAYRMQEQTWQLLEKAITLTADLRENEEELRQNMEEMQAIQEGIKCQRIALQQQQQQQQQQIVKKEQELAASQQFMQEVNILGIILSEKGYEYLNGRSRKLLSTRQAKAALDTLIAEITDEADNALHITLDELR